MHTLRASDFVSYGGERFQLQSVEISADSDGAELVAAVVGKRIAIVKILASDDGLILRSDGDAGDIILRTPTSQNGTMLLFGGMLLAATIAGENLFVESLGLGTVTGKLWYVEAA